MIRKPVSAFAVLAAVLLGTALWADQIILKDGTVYTGKFLRGDSKVIDFRILGRVETFEIADVAQIVFKEPELNSAAPAAPLPPAQPAPPAAPPVAGQGAAVTLPVGTALTIRTSDDIDTDRNRVGDAFDATLDQPLMFGSQMIAPRGSAVKGRIAYAKESGRLTGQAQLMLELTEVVANGKSYMLRTSDYSEAGASRNNRTAATVGGTSALGAIIGAIAGGGKGAAVGAASGAAVGTGVQVMTRGQVLKIPAETILEFRLQSPLTVDTP